MAGWLLYSPHIISNYAIHCSAYTINNGRTNVRQWLRQAYSPSPRCDAFFPNALLPLFPPLKGGGWGDVPLRSDTVYPA
ncbi:hypothetical protein BGK60_08290 [Tannerella forsythia]|nr:hypothetical protein BGK60_08290 [Tannerella forsythia]